jgi:hypothetical protein
VDETTTFRFTGGSGNGSVRLIAMESYYYATGLYIVTTNEEFTLPTVVQGAYELLADDVTEWYVETHGSYDGVDAIARPGGFPDPIGGAGAPVGPRRGDGSFTQTGYRVFTTAP